MYIPSEFKITDSKAIFEFCQQHPFGVLLQSGDSEPLGTHLPFLIKQDRDHLLLEGHIAAANAQSKHIRSGKVAMVILSGPHAYVSSSVYTHPNVPTWNYQAVHIYGTLEVMNEPELIEHLDEMVQTFEADRTKKLNLNTLPEELLESYRREIIGFRLTSYRTEAAFKLSQNRNETDHQKILNDLGQCPINKELLEAMKKHY
jgi:transcriptional regulator